MRGLLAVIDEEAVDVGLRQCLEPLGAVEYVLFPDTLIDRVAKVHLEQLLRREMHFSL